MKKLLQSGMLIFTVIAVLTLTGICSADLKCGTVQDCLHEIESGNTELLNYIRDEAETNNYEADFILCIMYTQKRGGVERDIDQAALLFWQGMLHGGDFLVNSDEELEAIFPDDLSTVFMAAALWDKDLQKYIQTEAENGNPAAQFFTGIFQLIKNNVHGIEWIEKAAGQDFITAITTLGNIYEDGDFVEKDTEEALKWYLKAAELGDVDSQCKAGEMYRKSQEPDKAIAWFVKAAEQGELSAQMDAACYYFKIENYPEALKWFLQAADQNSGLAQYYLGYMYEKGLGTENNTEAAMDWYQKSADQGFAWAQYNLAELILENTENPTEQDYKTAFDLYKQAAEHGMSQAAYALAVCYYDGLGVEQNFSEAYDWFSKYAETDQESQEAAEKYLNTIIEENGEKKADPQKQLENARRFTIEDEDWYRRAAVQGNAEAQWQYGVYLSKDAESAEEWYLKAAEQGCPEAQYLLADLYENTDRAEAADEWYKKAAEQNIAEAQYKLGEKCELAKNYEDAAEWYRKAAELGYKAAAVALAGFYENGTGIEQNDTEAAKLYAFAAEPDDSENNEEDSGPRKELTKIAAPDKNIGFYVRELAGYPLAMYRLGLMYADGRGVPQDMENAKTLIREAADENLPEAIAWITAAAENGDTALQLYLAHRCMSHSRITTDKLYNPSEAVKWYRLAAESGNAEAVNYLANIYSSIDKLKSAEYHWQAKSLGYEHAYDPLHSAQDVQILKEANMEDPLYLYLMGMKYYFGEDCEKDIKEAVKWFALAADKGDINAQLNLANIYLNGPDEMLDYDKAFLLLSDISEQLDLANIYRSGQDEMEDHKKALLLVNEAADYAGMGNQPKNQVALFLLSEMYRTGKGVRQDYTKAAEYFEKIFTVLENIESADKLVLGCPFVWWYLKDMGIETAAADILEHADRENSEVQNLLGLFYEKGIAVDANQDEAIKWFRAAAAQGNPQSQFHLGLYARNTEKTHNEGFEWFLKAAEQNYGPAQFQVGYYLEYGFVERDLDIQAMEWYKKAMENGNVSAGNRCMYQ